MNTVSTQRTTNQPLTGAQVHTAPLSSAQLDVPRATNPLATNPQTTTPLIRLQAIEHRYPNSEASVLRSVSADFHAGEVVAILGANGAGKTTLIQLMLGLLPLQQGELRVLDAPVRQLPLDSRRRAMLGVMMQNAVLPANLTVAEHLQLASHYHSAPADWLELAELCLLGDILDRRYSALSGGQKQSLQLALALLGQPRILFLDEPTAGLDVQARQLLWQQIRQAAARGVLVILTTHYLEEADQLASRIVLLKDGHFIADCSPSALKAQQQHKQIRCACQVSTEVIQSWPEVLRVQTATSHSSASSLGADLASQLHIESQQAEQTLQRLFALDPTLSDLTVSAMSLEQAFLNLTSQEHAA